MYCVLKVKNLINFFSSTVFILFIIYVSCFEDCKQQLCFGCLCQTKSFNLKNNSIRIYREKNPEIPSLKAQCCKWPNMICRYSLYNVQQRLPKKLSWLKCKIHIVYIQFVLSQGMCLYGQTVSDGQMNSWQWPRSGPGLCWPNWPLTWSTGPAWSQYNVVKWPIIIVFMPSKWWNSDNVLFLSRCE